MSDHLRFVVEDAHEILHRFDLAAVKVCHWNSRRADAAGNTRCRTIVRKAGPPSPKPIRSTSG
jgi:hypothetical protein